MYNVFTTHFQRVSTTQPRNSTDIFFLSIVKHKSWTPGSLVAGYYGVTVVPTFMDYMYLN